MNSSFSLTFLLIWHAHADFFYTTLEEFLHFYPHTVGHSGSCSVPCYFETGQLQFTPWMSNLLFNCSRMQLHDLFLVSLIIPRYPITLLSSAGPIRFKTLKLGYSAKNQTIHAPSDPLALLPTSLRGQSTGLLSDSFLFYLLL